MRGVDMNSRVVRARREAEPVRIERARRQQGAVLVCTWCAVPGVVRYVSWARHTKLVRERVRVAAVTAALGAARVPKEYMLVVCGVHRPHRSRAAAVQLCHLGCALTRAQKRVGLLARVPRRAFAQGAH